MTLDPAGDPEPFWPSVRGAAVTLMGPTVLLYAGTVFAWHAAAFRADLEERKVQAAELESMLNRAQLEALRSQLQPHFLFNTLHSIAELVHEDPARAEAMIVRLAELLRLVLNTPHREVAPLEDELAFIRGYIEIEQMRLGERLSVEWDVDPGALRARVPPLILQPLVENAIRHGIAPFSKPGRIFVRAHRDSGDLHIQIADTGPGLGPAANARTGGIGLANTMSRLDRMYGPRQSLSLVNSDGLTVHIRIPLDVDGARQGGPPGL